MQLQKGTTLLWEPKPEGVWYGGLWEEAPLVVACHDAGGSEVVSAWLDRCAKRRADIETWVVLEGPAQRVFRRKIGTSSLRQIDEGSVGGILGLAGVRVLTGTSWESDLEKRIRAQAAARGVPTAVFLDHWCQYRERFCWEQDLLLPDEVWVGDADALRLVGSSLPSGVAVRQVPNPYFDELKQEIRSKARDPLRHDAEGRILYVCEPIRPHLERMTAPPDLGYDEYTALEMFLRHLAATDTGRRACVRVRPHPSEDPTKYDAILSTFADTLMLERSASGQSLVEDCLWSTSVVGCESMALVVGLLAERRVFTAIPPGGRPCILPQAEIRSFYADHGMVF